MEERIRLRKSFRYLSLDFVAAGTYQDFGIPEGYQISRRLRKSGELLLPEYSYEDFQLLRKKTRKTGYQVFWCIQKQCFVVPAQAGFLRFYPPKTALPVNRISGEKKQDKRSTTIEQKGQENPGKDETPIILPTKKIQSCSSCVSYRIYFTETQLCMHPKHVRNIINPRRGENCNDYCEGGIVRDIGDDSIGA